jgi:NAD-dependent SIR2 family protein deacetylase
MNSKGSVESLTTPLNNLGSEPSTRPPHPPAAMEEDDDVVAICRHEGSTELAHGYLGSGDWVKPRMTKYRNEPARPGYAEVLAHEYNDEDDVLLSKVKLLARLVTAAKACILYTGAGLSTAAGISDYATKGDSTSAPTAPVSPIVAQPTYSHFALAELCRRGMVGTWIQQNHDGLPQKAGVSQEMMNEIHGAWFDPSNPVVKMSGQLREDLVSSLYAWEKRADLTIAMGTSMSGMNADRVFTTVARAARNMSRGKKLGGVIIGVQCTQYDDHACLRIFARIDVVMKLLMTELGIVEFPLARPVPPVAPGDLFPIRYDDSGVLVQADEANAHTLNLAIGAKLKITGGKYRGDIGEVMYVNIDGNYVIQFEHAIDPSEPTRKKKFVRHLGWWWINAAMNGTVPSIPVVNAPRLHRR